MNYLKSHVSTLVLTTVLVENIMDWYCDFKPDGPKYINSIKPVVYPGTNNWLATSLGNDRGELLEAVINLGYTDNSGHKRYGNMTVIYDEDGYYSILIDNFTITLEVHTPFTMDRKTYTRMYKTAKENISTYYEIEFKVPIKFINDAMLEYKLASN